jgi:CubicO group peptidase (beta-lactamase class C family)
MRSALNTILLAGVIALIAALPAQTHAQTTVSVAAVDVILDDLNQPGMPGCAVGVVQDGKLTLSRRYGLADVENGVPIGAETRFDIGSMSKQFLAMAILMLESDGRLLLDEDVHKYVPELPRYRWKITLRDLLHHTSGLKDYDQLLQVAGWADGDLKSVHDVLWIIERQKDLAFTPGTQYMYSDTNYFLLGLIAQRVTGKPIDSLLHEMIFDPLGMSHTSLRTDRWSLVPQKAWPYMIRDGKPRLYINAEEPLGDGGIFTTVGDLALWERNFDDPKVGGTRVVGDMQQVRPLRDGTANDYAGGLYIRTYRGVRMIEHSGTSYGYQAEKLRFPEQHLSVIVLCNRRDGTYVDLSNRLADLFLGLNARSDVKPSSPPSAKAELERFAGAYFSESSSDGVLIEARNGALLDVGEEREYRQTGPFAFKSSSGGTLCRCATEYTFRVGADGNVKGFSATRPSGSGTGKPTIAIYTRMSPAPKAALAEYVGEYVSEDVATSWCVSQKGDGLFVRRRGFADRPSLPLWKDAVDGPGGILQFKRERSRVTGFLLRNVRLTSVEFRKLPAGQHPVPAPSTCP